MSQQSWNELRELVLDGLKTLRDQQKTLDARIQAVEKEMAVLQARVLIYGAAIGSLVTLGINWMIK